MFDVVLPGPKTLTVPSLMKNLRRLAMSRIRADEVMKRQHWTATGGWKQRILRVLAWYLLLPVSAILIGCLVTGFGAVLGNGLLGGQLPRHVAVYFLSATGIATFVASSHTIGVTRQLVCSRNLAVTSVLPDSDRKYATMCLIASFLKTLLFLCGSFLLGGGAAYGAELNAVETVQVLSISALLWMMVVSSALIAAAFFPILSRDDAVFSVVGLTTILFFSGAGLVALGAVRQETLIFGALASLPTGWPILMIKHAVILGQPEYWQFLIPSGGVVAFAVFSWFRLLSRYRIQEFSYEPGAVAIAEFGSAVSAPANAQASNEEYATPLVVTAGEQSTSTSDWLKDCKRRFRKFLNLSDTEESTDELSRTEAVARIREKGLTKRFAWSEAGFVERAMAKILGEDELLAADILSRGDPSWSSATTKSLVPASAAVMLVVLAAMIIDRKIAVISGHVALGGMIGMFAGSKLATQWRSNSGEFCSALAILPVDARRVSRMLMTLGAIRSVMIFPLAFGVVLAITWGHSGRIEILDSTILAAKAALVLFMVHQWWFLIMRPYSHSKSVVRTILDILLFILVIGGMFAGICLLLTSGRDEIAATVGAALTFGGGWIVQALQRRRIMNAATDFVVQMQTQQRTTIQRQQQSKQTSRVPTFWPKPVDQQEPLS